jgi:hypothetical protein
MYPDDSPSDAQDARMAYWLKIALIVFGIVAGWVTVSVLTFDDSVVDFWPDKR